MLWAVGLGQMCTIQNKQTVSDYNCIRHKTHMSLGFETVLLGLPGFAALLEVIFCHTQILHPKTRQTKVISRPTKIVPSEMDW